MRGRIRTGAAALACVAAAFIGAACSGRRMLEGETPFPAKGAVMVDEAGNRLADLPPSAEPLRIIVLDFPWCPPCSDAWEALDKASKSVRGGRIRVFRILFDREKFDTAGGSAEASPLHPAPARPSTAFPVTTLTAMPAAFRERYKIEQAPVLLLADSRGRVLKRWVGYTPNLADSIRDELARHMKQLPAGSP
ncbi:MAG TPA: hypothetical protein VIU29_07295 [Candidatus Deferrimicrobiaceae bacterium]